MEVRPIELPADRAVVSGLADRLREHPGLSTLSESKFLAFSRGSARGLVGEEDHRLIACVVWVETGQPGGWAMEVLGDIDRESLGALVAGTVEAARTRGVISLRWWVYGAGAASIPGEFGFEEERRLHLMAGPLPANQSPRFPSGMEVTGFRPGVDDDGWLEVNNAAFAGHPENGDWTHAELSDRLEAEWFSAEGFRLAWAGGRSKGHLAGFCWTKIHPDGEGEIYVIAVAPSYQGRGLGRQLVLEGMRHLTGEGCPRIFLYTEGDNEAAVTLYSSLGLQIEDTHRAFRLVP